MNQIPTNHASRLTSSLKKNNNQTRNTIYQWLTYSLLLLISSFVFASQYFLSSNYAQKVDLPFLTGTPLIKLNSPLVNIEAKKTIDKMTLYFSDRQTLAEVNVKDGPYSVDVDKDLNSLNVIIDLDKHKKPEGSFPGISLLFYQDNSVGNFQPLFIEKIMINDRPSSLIDVMRGELVALDINAELYFPFAVQNISGSVANYLKNTAPFVIISILLVMLMIQLCLWIISFGYVIPAVSDYFSNPETNTAVTPIDSICEKFSIPLGFLGTVISLWIALEVGQENFENFQSILNILKTAVFSSVLGLSVKLICIARQSRFSLIKG